MTSENHDPAPSGQSDSCTPAGPVAFEVRANLPFTVVGIGASAGGVTALTQLFEKAPSDAGIAYVVIQHLPPDGHSLMRDILARRTAMPVAQIEDDMRVEPDHVYVIRPGFTVTLEQGVFRCGPPVEQRGHRHPVDDLFRSLAKEQKERAIVVVLSGTGTNGTAGAQAIKAAGGLCIAQDLANAEFAGMPRSLIDSGYADQVLPAEDIGPFINSFIHNPVVLAPEVAAVESASERNAQAMRSIHALLRTKSGYDFRGYRQPTVLRRIQRRMGVAGITDLANYAQLIRERHDEAVALANDLMINVTGFFRDPEAWEALRAGTVAPLVDSLPDGAPLRAWAAACASGEEAYSLAMLIAEEADRVGKRFEVKVFATDTAERSLALARAGVYPGGIEGDISQDRLDRFFEKDEHSYRIKREIRDMVVFASQNLLQDPPFSRLDLCTCRNLLIYLEPHTQQRVLSMLAFSIRNGGYLFLGSAESLGASEHSFEIISRRWRIYRRMGPLQHRLPDMSFTAARSQRREIASPEKAATPVLTTEDRATLSFERALLAEFTPPTVVVDREERMLYVTGDVSPYVMYPIGEVTSSIVEVARPTLRSAVRTVLRRAMDDDIVSHVDAPLEPEQTGFVRITAAPLRSHAGGRNLRLSFETRTAVPQVGGEPSSTALTALAAPTDEGLEDEIRVLRRELQATLEAFEASNEELKSSNEEVLSVNEELQSANEELETSKEELQSLNEELTTVNQQLQVKIGELEQHSNDLSNLLGSTNIAVMFLDTQLRVRRFTPAMQDLLELIPSDVGRPFNHLAPKFVMAGSDEAPHESMRRTAMAVLEDLVFRETEVHSRSGRRYMQRTLPYRSSENRIEGVVLTFIDVTARFRAEQALAYTQTRLQAAIEQNPAALIIVEAEGSRVVQANRKAAALFGQPYPPPFLNHSWADAVRLFEGWSPERGRLELGDWPLERALATGAAVSDFQMEVALPAGRRHLSVSAAPVLDEDGNVLGAVSAFWDVTAMKIAESAARDSARRLGLIVESARDFAIIMLDRQGRVTEWSPGAERVFGWDAQELVGKPVARIFTPEDRLAKVPQLELEKSLQDGFANDLRWHMRKDDSRFWANGVMTLARDESGEVIGFVKILRDDTERKIAEDSLHVATALATEAQTRAEAANRTKDDFISMVSHELRTPLTTMRLWLRLLGNEKMPVESRRDGLKTMERAISAQEQLIEDLLDVSRMATGKLRLEIRPTRFSDAIHAAVETVRPIAERKDITLIYQTEADIGIVRVDPERMQQVVWNLLSNAVKFTPSGGTVTTAVELVPEGVSIRVTDTGVGIHEELLPRIFERFEQGESGTSRHHAGLGLGLAIAKQLIEQHGGTITARSEGHGQGSTFTIWLPIVPEELDIAPPPAADTGAGSDALRGVRVLLVEDESATRDACRRVLEARGVKVRSCDSSPSAQQAFEIETPDVVVSDIGMPGEDGYVLMQKLRRAEASRGLPRTPAIALTAFARREDRERALAAGFDAQVNKPVNAERLIQEIANLVGRPRDS